jgi:hypothetical protein
MSFDERAFQVLVLAHVWPIFVAVLAPSFMIDTFGIAGAAQPSDLIYSHWFGIWTISFAFLYYFGSRTQFVFQSHSALFAGLLFASAGSLKVLHPALVIPHIAFFLFYSIKNAGVLKPLSLPTIWSDNFTPVQNFFRIYIVVALLGNGIAWLFFPKVIAAFVGVPAPTSYGLAFNHINAITMLATTALAIEVTDKRVLRNWCIIFTLLYVLTRIVRPEAFFSQLYIYAALNLIGAAVFHF